MSLNDGKITKKHLYLTTDKAFSAYLIMRGFELLGVIDDGSPKKKFGLTHTEPDILAKMDAVIASMFDEYENLYLPIPHDKTARVNFKQYNYITYKLYHALDEAIRRER